MDAREIFETTGLNRVDSNKVAAALTGAPAFVVSSFRAMLKAGFYSADEMVERIRALRSMARGQDERRPA